ncbi:hypothetical protein VTK26DRAFT_1150 [Humicola hyalothermophila]
MADRDSTKDDGPVAEKIETPGSASGSDELLETNEHAHLTLKQSLKKWRRVVLFSLLLSSGILMYGYDYVIVGTASAMPSFLRDFGVELNGEQILPSMWLGLWNFISPGCSMVGAVAGGFFQDRFGRRASLAVGSFLSAVGVAVCFASNKPAAIDSRRGMFLAGKGFQGGAIGMVMATASTHMSEILPPNLRGPILAFFPIFTLLGQVIGALVIYACLNHDNGYAIAFATQWPFSALPLLSALIVPESPAFLIRCATNPTNSTTTSSSSLETRAFAAQRRLDGPRVPPSETALTLRRLRAHIAHEQSLAQPTYRDMLLPPRRDGGATAANPNLRRTLIVVFASLVPQLFGLTLLSKGSYFIQVVGMDADLSVVVLIAGIVCGLLANVASMPVLARWGRRPLMMGGLGAAAVWWGTMGVAGCWAGEVVVWYSAAMMIAVIVCCGLGAWPAAMIVCAETSALHLRAKAQGISWLTAGAGNSLFGFVLPYIFNPDQGNLRGKTGFVYAGLCLLGVVITYFAVPEMKGRTPAEIDRMFELGLPARKFKEWKNPSVTGEEETGAEKV